MVCTVIGTVTTVALRSHLYDQLDGQLQEIAARASGAFLPPDGLKNGTTPGGQRAGRQNSDGQNADGQNGDGRQARGTDLTDFVTRGPQPPGTIAATLTDGTVTEAKVGDKVRDDNNIPQMEVKSLGAAQREALATVVRDGDEHTVEIPGLGDYRVRYASGPNGRYYVAIPTEDADSTISTLILVEISITAAGLVAAGIAGWVLVSVATRPLRKVAATATRVSELPLHTGEVNLEERVPESETDPHTEVGRVGAHSTGCSTTSTAPCTPASRARRGYGSSSRTPAMSCAPRSPPSAATPS